MPNWGDVWEVVKMVVAILGLALGAAIVGAPGIMWAIDCAKM